jgi:hypothetical protein
MKRRGLQKMRNLIRLATADYRIVLLAMIGVLAISLGCVYDSYTNDAMPTASEPGEPIVQSSFTGQWLIEFRTGDVQVQLSLRYRSSRNGPGFSNNSFPVTPDQLQGLAREQAMSSSGTRVQFQLKRDAGTFNCEGWFRDGQGSGHFVFSADPAFAAELKREGYGQPSAEQQFSMALHDVSLAFIAELKALGYQRPTLDQLVEAGEHGVRLDYLKGLQALGYNLRTLESLIEMKDHGVSLVYIREMAALGFDKLSAAQLVETKDHGVSPDFVKAFRAAGYDKLSLSQLIEAKDHGASARFVAELQALGYSGLSIEELIEMKDHGVKAGFIRDLKQLGYEHLSVDQLIRLSDHGISIAFIRKMKARGYNNLDQIVGLGDRGEEN